MRWSVEEIAAATGGRLHRGGPAGEITGVSIDSRTMSPGEMFVALRGERDGHDFAGQAAERGAAAALVERPVDAPVAQVVVADTAAALLDLGRASRARLEGAVVVGITGSVGKTSTKDLTAAALAGRRAVASRQSFNNELGLPLTLANAPAGAEVVVLEMGARGHGHIALLCDVARPSVGVVTAVAEAHTEMLGDLDGVARAKSELVVALGPEGTAVLNGDDERTRAMARLTRARSLTYSVCSPTADLVAEAVTLDDELRASFRARTPWGDAEVHLPARGAHQVGNALAALAVAGVAGVPVGEAAAHMAAAEMSPLRMELTRAPGGAAILNDAYNANPRSMSAALRALASIPAERRVAVLGQMAELGPHSRSLHAGIAGLAAELGIELVAVGTDQYGVEPTAREEVVDRIGPLDASVAVLLKGSRVAGLEDLARELASVPGETKGKRRSL